MEQDDDLGRSLKYRLLGVAKALKKYVQRSFVREFTGEVEEDEYEETIEDPRTSGAILSERLYVEMYKIKQ